MSLFEEFKKIVNNPQLYLSNINSIGYMCNYVPEEMIYAAGFTPVRLNATGSEGTSSGDMYFSTGNCSFPRRILDKGISGAYDFLSGIIFMNGCDHNRRLFDNWNYAGIKTPFTWMLFVPHSKTEASLNQYINELYKLHKFLEENASESITDQKLLDAISVFRRKRVLLKELSGLRGKKLKGSEFLTVMLATSVMPPEKSIEMLELFISELNEKPDLDNNLRVLVTGNCVEEIEHLEILENAGAEIVYDNICLGSRYFDRVIEVKTSPLEDLATGYLRAPSCPRIMNDTENRIKSVKKAVYDHNIDAVVIEKLEFCSMMTGEGWILSQELRKESIPYIILTRELYGGGKSQIKTRIQAFYEKVKNLK